jgi:ATP-binding cassette subfamily B protein
MQGRTSFVIAQRISTVRNADLILVLDGGQVAAQGKHEELLEESPIYAEIFNSQLVADADQAGALAGDNRAAGSPVLAGAQQEP